MAKKLKMQFEISNYLPSKMLLLKYLRCPLDNSVQLVPKFKSHTSSSLVELKLFLL